jgi:hypothetical protein
MDSHGDGWNGGFIEIQGIPYCDNFASGSHQIIQITIGNSVACENNDFCANGEVCDTTVPSPVCGACTNNDFCLNGEVCDTTATPPICVACENNDFCANGEVCDTTATPPVCEIDDNEQSYVHYANRNEHAARSMESRNMANRNEHAARSLLRTLF